jgi:DinB superfamily
MKNLEPIISLLSSSRSKFIATIDVFPPDHWRESPGENKWSAAEIVTHTMQVEEAIVAGSRKTLQKPPYKVSFLKRFHLPLALASGRTRKIQSPIRIDERRIPAKSDYLEKITATRGGTLNFIQETSDRDLRPYTFPHSVFGSLSIYDWLRLVAYHELRHAKQIREVAEIFHR